MALQQAKPKAEALNAHVIAEGKWFTEYKKKNKVGNLTNYNEYKSFINKFEVYTRKEGIKLEKERQKLGTMEEVDERLKNYALMASTIDKCIKSISPDKSYAHLLNCLIILQANLLEWENVHNVKCFGSQAEWTAIDLILGKIVLANFPDPLKDEFERMFHLDYDGEKLINISRIFTFMHECIDNCMLSNVSNSSCSKSSSDQRESSEPSLSTNSVVMSSSPSPEDKFKPCVVCKSTSHALSNCDNCSYYEDSSVSPEGKFKPCVFCVSTSHASSNCDNYSS